MLVWGILIAKYCGAEQAHISYPLGIKEGSGFKYGSQINTLLLPVDFSHGESFKDLYQRNQELIQQLRFEENYKYSYLPIAEIANQTNVKELNVAFAQTDVEDRPFKLGDSQGIVNHRYNIFVTGTELILAYQPALDEFTFHILYNSSLFNEAWVQNLSEDYLFLLRKILASPKKPVVELSLLTPKKYQKIVHDWNQTDRVFPRDKTIQQLFEEQVAKTPHLIAAVFREESLTYEELNAKANQLAYYIRNQYKQKTKKRLKPDVLIALCLDRSLDILIGILAVLKAGGAYVPIDPKYPAERIQFILTDTNAALLLTQSHLKKSLEKIASKPAPQMIAIDTRPYINEGNTNLPTYSAPNHLAYVIYTSGTTGNPKGVMIEQHSLVALITQYTHACPYPNLDNPRVLSLTNYTFDISGLEFYLPLLKGGVTVLAQIDNLEASIINTHRINVIQQTPSVWKQILEMIPPEQLQGITCLMGGEVVDQATLQKMQANASEVINGYGPSETTIYSTRYVYGKESRTPAVIGKPLPNEKVYVLDGKLNPVPIGVIGELYIGGEKLARGYLNRPKLTKERFIRNPFASKSDRSKKYTRLYKTGDLVRWLPDGNLEYRGRNDFQVKIHGYRIELGEVEHALMKIPGIRNGVVLAKTKHPGDPTSHYLAAYYVSKYPLDVNYLRSELSKHVPQYMIPTAFVHMPSLPLSPSGKLNRKALPDPDFHKHTEAYVAPRNEIETQLAQLWQEVLDIKRIGINDNFFKIGGDSIKAIQLIHKANQLGIHLQTGNLFQQPTIANLAKSVTPSAAKDPPR
ncbi:amino acid adenylation domain-containing protein [Coxiella burnetii]|uniref:non-ribosomal peptide synthetase n=1 Tax=Coxiella burnetii TaxID=777 RepID=UPI0021763BA0|nr:amino acid adenylation domain-containing protein [Coxiella burnetii]